LALINDTEPGGVSGAVRPAESSPVLDKDCAGRGYCPPHAVSYRSDFRRVHDRPAAGIWGQGFRL